jgi:hypothetical protein
MTAVVGLCESGQYDPSRTGVRNAVNVAGADEIVEEGAGEN